MIKHELDGVLYNTYEEMVAGKAKSYKPMVKSQGVELIDPDLPKEATPEEQEANIKYVVKVYETVQEHQERLMRVRKRK